jgi:quercetin dioxygenase-like cupin family protein
MGAEREIHNVRMGQRMTFAGRSGAELRIETVNPPSEAMEPLHIHPRQESGAIVSSGSLRFLVAGEERLVRAGEEIVIPAGVPHRFWNDGDEDALATQFFRPALNIEAFFRRLFALAADGRLNEKGVPGPLDSALIIADFGEEIRLVAPPWPLQRAFAAVLAPLARGRRRELVAASS